MEAATYIGLSYQSGLGRQMDVIANNIANVNTPGYKERNVMFDSYINDPQGLDTPYLSANDFGEFVNPAQGVIKPSGRPLDVAVEGPGYFGVITGDGVKYSRAGNFALNSVGELVNPNGLRIADDTGAPISIPEGTAVITINNDGTVSADGSAVGQIMIREFADINTIKPIGGNLVESDTPPIRFEPGSTKLLQGMIEGSNVNSIRMSTELLEVSRKYLSMQRMIQGENERVRDAISRLSQTR